MMVKFFIFMGGVVILGLIAVATVKALKRADIEEKIEDINDTAEQYNRIKDIDVDKVQEQKKKVKDFKSL